MIVTDLKYGLENRLIKKLDIMVARCVKNRDAVLIVEGSEGEGKTNTSEAVAYYVKSKTKRNINMFFRLQPLIEFAQKTEGQLIIWDEPALDSLSTDWFKSINKDLVRLLMTCRKKKHFFIFNFVKFYKFSEYVVVDRALGLIHMYSRNGTEQGRFVYIRQKNLENLFTLYKKSHVRGYKKYRSFGGSIPIVEKYFDKMGITIEGKVNCTLNDYERLKDGAIESIGQEQKGTNKQKKELQELKHKIGGIKMPITNLEDFADKLGVTRKTLYNWFESLTKNGNILRKTAV